MIPSGYVKMAPEMAIYSEFSQLDMVIFHDYVSLSEGISKRSEIYNEKIMREWDTHVLRVCDICMYWAVV